MIRMNYNIIFSGEKGICVRYTKTIFRYGAVQAGALFLAKNINMVTRNVKMRLTINTVVILFVKLTSYHGKHIS